MKLITIYAFYMILIFTSFSTVILPVISMNIDKQLADAIGAGNIQQVQALVRDHGANVNMKNGLYTPLIKAVCNNQKEIVKILLAAGADPTVEIANNFNALCLAIELKHKEILQALVKTTQGQNNWQALFLAIEQNNKDIVQTLINAGINLNLTDQQGSTALMVATCQGDRKLVKMLLAARADFSLKDNKQYTVFTLAKQRYSKYVFPHKKKCYQKIGHALLEAYIAQKKLRGILSALTRYFQQHHIPQDVIQHIFSFVPLFFTKHDELIAAQNQAQQAIQRDKCSIQ